MIKENLKEVEERIAKACERVGRDKSEVTLIAVSKTNSKKLPMSIFFFISPPPFRVYYSIILIVRKE